MLLKIIDGKDFTTVAGLRIRNVAFNSQTVDLLHAESVARWRELLSGAGVRRASFAGGGIFKDAASDAMIRQLFFDGAEARMQIVVPDFGTIEGPFQIASLEYAGTHEGEVAFDVSLESTGTLSYEAA